MKVLLALLIVSCLLFTGSYALDNNDSWFPIQISVIDPIALPPVNNVYGLKLNLLHGFGNNVMGFNYGVIGSSINKMSGLQWGFVFNSANELKGIQTAFIIGYADTVKPFSLQLSAINIASNNGGFQLGIVNIAQNKTSNELGFCLQWGCWNSTAKLRGLQLGLINIVSDDFEGWQIGFYNISPNWFFPFISYSPFKS